MKIENDILKKKLESRNKLALEIDSDNDNFNDKESNIIQTEFI